MGWQAGKPERSRTHTSDTTGPPDRTQGGVGGWGGYSSLYLSYSHLPLAVIQSVRLVCWRTERQAG
eukprot:8557967-Pyramimonas_sp.AAC.1